jgi:hypothetical protein
MSQDGEDHGGEAGQSETLGARAGRQKGLAVIRHGPRGDVDVIAPKSAIFVPSLLSFTLPCNTVSDRYSPRPDEVGFVQTMCVEISAQEEENNA